jgi:hypothetical protein
MNCAVWMASSSAEYCSPVPFFSFASLTIMELLYHAQSLFIWQNSQ